MRLRIAIESALGLPPREVLRRTWHQIHEDDVFTYAGSLAFHGILAVFPMLVFLVALLSSLDLTELMDRILVWGSRVLPREGSAQIVQVIEDVNENGGIGLLSVGGLGALWASSGGVRSAMIALNRAYNVPEARTAWKRYLLSLLYTLGLSALAVLAAGLLLVGENAIGWVADQIGSDRALWTAWSWLRLPLAVGLLMVATAVAYSVLPNLPGFRWITPGAVVSVALWIVLSLGFRMYIDNFGRYNVLYGSLGAVIVLMLYFWLSAAVLLIGGEMNAVIHLAHEQRARSAGEPIAPHNASSTARAVAGSDR